MISISKKLFKLWVTIQLIVCTICFAAGQSTILFHDDFSSNKNNWKVDSTGDCRYTFKNGRYTIDSRNQEKYSNVYAVPQCFSTLPTNLDVHRDFVIEAEFNFLNELTGIGLVFGHLDDRNFQCFFVTGSRNASVCVGSNSKLLQTGELPYPYMDLRRTYSGALTYVDGRQSNRYKYSVNHAEVFNKGYFSGADGKCHIKIVKNSEGFSYYLNHKVYMEKDQLTLQASGIGFRTNLYSKIEVVSITVYQDPAADPPATVRSALIKVNASVIDKTTKAPVQAKIKYQKMGYDELLLGGEGAMHSNFPLMAICKDSLIRIHAEAEGYLPLTKIVPVHEYCKGAVVDLSLPLIKVQFGAMIQFNSILFARSTANMLPSSTEELKDLVGFLLANKKINLTLLGHTDNVGDAKANLKLSQERVDVIRMYLIKNGIEANRIVGMGYGGSKPIAPNDTEANRQLNRRVEFVLQEIK